MTTHILVEDRTQQQAKGMLGAMEHDDAELVIARGDMRIAVSGEMLKVLSQVIQSVARGGTIQVGTLPEELTTSVAADLLGISRGTLMKLIGEGGLPSHMVGSHHRLRRDDVLEFRRARLVRQRAALSELLDLESELGMD
ncbi:helix-turn-helix domain-containing protein [Mariniluteicoccus flavus]